MTDVKKEEIGYAWNLIADLGNSRQLSISGNFNKGTTPQEMNAEVDKIRALVDRQQAKSASRAAGEEIEQLQLRYDFASQDMQALNEKHGDKSLSSAERQQKEAAKVHLQKMAADIEYKKTVLAKLQDEAK